MTVPFQLTVEVADLHNASRLIDYLQQLGGRLISSKPITQPTSQKSAGTEETLIILLGNFTSQEARILEEAELFVVNDLCQLTAYAAWRKVSRPTLSGAPSIFGKLCNILAAKNLRFNDASLNELRLRAAGDWIARHDVSKHAAKALERLEIFGAPVLKELSDTEIEDLKGVGPKIGAELRALRNRFRREAKNAK